MTNFLAWLKKKLTGFWRWFKGLWRELPETEMTEPKRIDIREFWKAGYLLEANRQFFHPLGLALEVVIDEDGTCRLGGVHDYRDDPEGLFFAEIDDADRAKAERIKALWHEKAKVRMEQYGYVIQPMEVCVPATEPIGKSAVRHSPEWECNNRCLLDHPNEPHCNCDLCRRLGVCVPATNRIGHDDKGQACKTG